MKKRHKWNFNPKHRNVDTSASACVNCGMVRQYVKGIATYFINDTVYDRKAPECKPILTTPK